MICKTCGRELPDTYAFCSYCGTDLRNINVAASDQQSPEIKTIVSETMVAPEIPGTSEVPDTSGSADVRDGSTTDNAIALQTVAEESAVAEQKVAEDISVQVNNEAEISMTAMQNVIGEPAEQTQNVGEEATFIAQNVVKEPVTQVQNVTDSPITQVQNKVEDSELQMQKVIESPVTPVQKSVEEFAPQMNNEAGTSVTEVQKVVEESAEQTQNVGGDAASFVQNAVKDPITQVQNVTENPVASFQNGMGEFESHKQNVTDGSVTAMQNVVEETAEVTQNNVEAVGTSTQNVTEGFSSISEMKLTNEMNSDIPVFQNSQITEQKIEIDPEAGTTVLTAGMSGPLTAEMNAANSFAGSESYDKVVTPAPVTTSSILSNESVLPVKPTVQAYQYNGTGVNYGAPVANRNINNSYPVNNYSNNDLITPWGYVGYSLLFAIPILGLVMLFVYGFGEGHSQNLRNYARGNLLMILLVFGIEIVLMIFMAILGVSIFSIFG